MNPAMLFAVQLLPLIVFIVVDAFVMDVRISIACAVVFAVFQLIFTWLRSRRFDWFVLVDVGLIAALGGVSIVFENELFFKVKPAIMEGLAVVLFVALILAPTSFIQSYFGRMMPGRALNPEALGRMKTMIALLLVGTIAHIGAVLYAAFYTTRQTWAFISGPGFYLFALPIPVVYSLSLRFRVRS